MNKHTKILLYASRVGQIELIKFALENGANIHADNDCALCWAAYYGHTSTVKLLLENGANIHADNDSALRWAKTKEIEDLLLEYSKKGAASMKISLLILILMVLSLK